MSPEEIMKGRAAIAAALHQVMGEVSYVQKSGENKFHGYKYASEADLLDVLRPSMVKHGIMLIPSCTEFSAIDQHGNIHVMVEYTLIHKDGWIWPHPIRALGAGNDKNKGGVGDKGAYKALTGANKYLLFKLFQIETGDDPESDSEREERQQKQSVVEGPNPEVVEALMTKISEFEDRKAMSDWWNLTKPTLAAQNLVNDPKHPGGASYVQLVKAITARLKKIDELAEAARVRDQDPALAALDDKPSEPRKDDVPIEQKRVQQLVDDDVPF